MKTQIGDTVLELAQGDITQQDVDAIVNAANSSLAPGAGVCGAIRAVGGAEIFWECRQYYKRCATGEAVITGAGQLPARHVIHAVGPIYRDGYGEEATLLAGAYRFSLRLAKENKLKSIAFPSLSTGIYGYPVDEAAPIALGTIAEFLRSQPHDLQLVRFVLFDDKTLSAYEEALRGLNLEA
jgi:O-acetyl-ADP-ribose deacetylase (regulator of RNase III)